MDNQIEFRGKTIKYQHRDGFWQLLESGDWEPETFDVLDRYVKPGKTVIDIGAWQGAISIYSHLMGANVYSVEPDLVAYGQLFDNIMLNSINERIRLYNIAIGEINGTSQLNSMVSEFGNSESSLVDRGLIGVTQEIDVLTLEYFVDKNKIVPSDICLIKIDIEGGEIMALRGSLEWITKHKPIMYVAFHPAWLEPLDENINFVLTNLFPIYKFVSPLNPEWEFTDKQFIDGLKVNHHHSFVLIPK